MQKNKCTEEETNCTVLHILRYYYLWNMWLLFYYISSSSFKEKLNCDSTMDEYVSLYQIRYFAVYIHTRSKFHSIFFLVSKKRQCIAKTLYRKFETNIPRNDLCGFVLYSYIHVSVSGLVCLFCCSKIDGPIVAIFKSLTDTRIWKLGTRPRSFISGNT